MKINAYLKNKIKKIKTNKNWQDNRHKTQENKTFFLA